MTISTDTTNAAIANAFINDPSSQRRVQRLFYNGAIANLGAAIAVQVNASTAAGNGTLHFASDPGAGIVGQIATDLTVSSAFPAGTAALTHGTATTISQVATAPGVGATDNIQFAPYYYNTVRAFCFALFKGTVSAAFLCTLLLTDSTIYTNVTSDGSTPGGNVTDAQITTVINNIFQTVALSGSW